ncbi:AGE family epimerase/isomerase [Planctomycetota bacterium]
MEIDRYKDFFRDHLTDLLYRWLEAAADEDGFFHPVLDRTWQRHGRPLASLVSQSRLIFNCAAGFRLTGDDRFREAAARGAGFLIEHFLDQEYGGWYQTVTDEGHPVDTAKDSYGHAFAVFALAHAYGLTGNGLHLEWAHSTLDMLRTHFADSEGGFCRYLNQDFSPRDTSRSQNPLMHLFEALLILDQVDPEGPAHEAARGIGDFVLFGLMDQEKGFLPEVYDDIWQPLPESKDGRIDIGHQFEWAFLSSEAVGQGFPETYVSQGTRLLEYGLSHGRDSQTGAIFSPADYEGSLRHARTGWWEQCEAIRALHRYQERHDRTDLTEARDQLITFVKKHCIDPEHGGWYSAIKADGAPAHTDKGSIWKVDYHVTGMAMELIGEEGIAKA